MTSARRPVVAALAALLLCGAWLRWGIGWAGGLLPDASPMLAELAFTLVVYAPLLLLAIAGTVVAGIGAGIRPRVGGARAAAMRGALVGGGGLLLAVGYAALAGTLEQVGGGDVGAPLLIGAGAVLFQVIAEEWLFRGLVQPAIGAVAGSAASVAIAAVAFAAMHAVAGGAGALQLANLFGGGLLFGLLRLRDGGVAGAIGAHAAWNGGEQLLLGLDPNPGVGGFGSAVDLDLAGSPLWGGSTDGLNASLAMAFALAALVAWLALAGGRRRPG